MLGKKPTYPFSGRPKSAPQTPAPPDPSSTSAPTPSADGLALQVLTAGYIANGYLDPIEMALVGYLNVPTQVTITLRHARVRVLGANVDTGQMLPEIIVPKATMIALIPQNDAATRSAVQQMPPRAERALIYAGPYVIRGAFRLMGDMPLWNLFNAFPGDMLAVSDAEIDCQLPGVRFPETKPVLMILNKMRVQLYHPA